MATPSEKHEIHCAKRYLEYTETPLYRAFRDKSNPHCADANYAVLKRMEEAEQSLAAVEKYYRDTGIVPVFYSKPDSVHLEECRALFKEHGYTIAEFTHQRMMHLMHTSPGLRIHGCPVKIFSGTAVSGAEAQLLRERWQDTDWGEKLLAKQLSAGAQVSFAYNRAEIPVSYCIGEEYGGAFCLSDAFTSEKFRRQGYGAAAMLLMMGYARKPERCYTDLFLHARSAQAISLCEKLGFRGTPVKEYRAFKGGIPQWFLHQMEE